MRSARAVRREVGADGVERAVDLGQDARDARRAARGSVAANQRAKRWKCGRQNASTRGEPSSSGEMRVGDARSARPRCRPGARRDKRAAKSCKRAMHDLAAHGRVRLRAERLAAARASRCPRRRSRKGWRSTARCGSRSVCFGLASSGGLGSGRLDRLEAARRSRSRAHATQGCSGSMLLLEPRCLDQREQPLQPARRHGRHAVNLVARG